MVLIHFNIDIIVLIGLRKLYRVMEKFSGNVVSLAVMKHNKLLILDFSLGEKLNTIFNESFHSYFANIVLKIWEEKEWDEVLVYIKL